jgi:hypothetical protein
MTVEGFASLREFIRRAVRQINGVPNDVLSTLENQVRLHHELLLDAWDEMRDRGAAVIHVTDSEYERTRQLINEILQAEGATAATLRRAQNPVARAIIEMIVQEVTAHQEPRLLRPWSSRTEGDSREVRQPGHTEIVGG